MPQRNVSNHLPNEISRVSLLNITTIRKPEELGGDDGARGLFLSARCCIPLQPLVASINQPKALIVIEGYDVVVTSDRARWRGQNMRHKKLKRGAGGRGQGSK